VIGPLLVHALLAPLGRLLMPAAVRSVFAPDLPPPGYARRAGVMLLLRPEHYRANVRDLAGLKDFVRAQSRHYGEMKVPVAILHGTADRTVSIDIHARALAAAVPRARLWVLEGAGHMPHHSRPQALREAVEWILAQG
jgi:pimeloyl-ACP methyl ester carboxylesterase